MNRRILLIILTLLIANPGWGQQRVRFPKAAVPISQASTAQQPTVQPPPAVPSTLTTQPAVAVPPVATTNITPVVQQQVVQQPPAVTLPQSQLGAPQTFDGYAFPPTGAASTAPVATAPTTFMNPAYGANPAYGTACPPVVVQPPPVPTAGNPGFQSAGPPVLYPQGIATPQWPTVGYQPQRFIQAVRFKHAWLHGDVNNDPREVDINDSTISLVTRWENFTGSPFFIMPGFALHLWGGPQSPPVTDGLPSKVYDAFVDWQWIYAPQPFHSFDLHMRMGIFTDFKGVTSDSFRVLGGGTYNMRLTDTIAFKLGAEYVNRHSVKLLPAFGVLWTPNDYTRWDVFFPQPKLSQRLASLGTMDVWWYIGGEYGGGVWSVQRPDQSADNVNINDLRVYLGLEWGSDEQLRAGRRTIFFEAGYVWDREVSYVASPFTGFKPRDTFMLRGGIGY